MGKILLVEDEQELAVQIKDWLVSRNLKVNFEASNRMLIAFSGSVKDFNATFQTTLHICLRKNPHKLPLNRLSQLN